MASHSPGLITRLERLERSVRRLRLLAGTAGVALVATWVSGAASPRASQQDAVRTRLLVIADAQGHDRIVLGAPMPDGRQFVGMKILNPEGVEQFGLGLKPNGSVSMGFDTKPGVGNPANTERLNMGVTATGQGWIRYLDNDTRARMRIALDSADAPSIQLLDWPSEHRIVVREIRFAGDTTLEWQH